MNTQSPDISMGVNQKEIGAGDQGMMYGYATNETNDYLPLPLVLAHRLTKRLTYCRKNKILSFLRPDGKSQVSVEYLDNKVRIDSIIVSSQITINTSLLLTFSRFFKTNLPKPHI